MTVQPPALQPPGCESPAPLKRKGVGVASLVIGVLLAATLMVAVPIIVVKLNRGVANLTETFKIAMAMTVLGSAGISLVGIVVAIVGIALKSERKIVSVFGLLLNVCLFFFVVLFFLYVQGAR